MIPDPFLQLFVALGLGLLVGMQRERVDPAIAGIRTFALITVLGTLAALLGRSFGGWIVAVGLLVAAALVMSGNMVRLRQGEAEPGQTTEFTALVMYCVGALVVVAPLAVSVVLGGAVAVLLHLKDPLHRLVDRMGEKDIRAIMQLVLLALVILPILPDRPFGPYDVLNPYQIWWMVVLIVSLSLAGYLALKLFGANAGSVLSGVLGGLVSSTATTVGYARSARKVPESARLAALVISIASAVVFVRVLVEISVVAPSYLIHMGPPIGTMLGVTVVVSLAAWLLGRDRHAEPPEPHNPADLKAALVFGALYAGVLLAVEFARERFGTTGLYAVAAISGLTDMDAITLSTSRLVVGGLDPSTGWRAILLAGLANLVFKAGIAGALGSRQLFLRIALLFGLELAAGGLIFWLWP